MWKFLAKFFSKAWQAVAGKALGSQRVRASMVVHQGSGWRTWMGKACWSMASVPLRSSSG